MNTIERLLPRQAEFPSATFPILASIDRRPVLDFVDTVSQSAQWTGIAAQGMTGTLTLVVYYAMDTATSGTIGFRAQVEAIAPGDAQVITSDSFDTADLGSETVPATAQSLSTLSITLTNADSIAAGDYFRLILQRDTSVGGNASGVCHVLAAELRAD